MKKAKQKCGPKPKLALGTRHGMLVVTEFLPDEGRYLCACDCGNTVKPRGGSINAGHTRSCGCLKRSPIPAITSYVDATGADSATVSFWQDIKFDNLPLLRVAYARNQEVPNPAETLRQLFHEVPDLFTSGRVTYQGQPITRPIARRLSDELRR